MVLAFLPMRTPYYQPRSESQAKSFFSDIKEAIVYIFKGERVILHLMILSLIPNVLLHPVWFMFPIFTVEVLKAGPDVGGYLLAITGLGGLIAALVISSFGFIFKKGKLVLVSVLFSSITVIIFAHSPLVPVAFVVIAAMAFFQSGFRTTNGTLIQTLVPDELRSRVTSLQSIGMGLVLFSSLAIGWFVSLTSVVFAITIVGLVGVGLSLAMMLILKRVGRLE